MLLYADFIKDEELFAQAFNEMKTVREQYIMASKASACSFEYTVLESLIFTDRKNEIQFLLENNTYQDKSGHQFIPAHRKNTHDEVWKILCAVGYHKIGQIEKSLQYAETIDLENLGFGWRKYYSMVYYFLLVEISEIEEQKKIATKLRDLLDETFFSYYENQISKIEISTGVRQAENLVLSD